MVDSANTLLQEFQKQKVSHESEVLQSAQRLINQFRSLHLFKESFVQEYNNQLLACSADVRRFLPSLMGGNEVRNYLEFLEKQQPRQADKTEDLNRSKIAADGYLPEPDSDDVASDTSAGASVSRAEFQQMQAQQKALMEQTQQLLKKMGVGSADSSAMGHYSEIIEEDS